MTIQFQVGQTYETRSVCDHDCIIRATVLSRSAKRVTVQLGDKVKMLGVGVYEGVEFIRPWGNYSMAPVIRASVPL